jgi:hypothetical protein
MLHLRTTQWICIKSGAGEFTQNVYNSFNVIPYRLIYSHRRCLYSDYLTDGVNRQAASTYDSITQVHIFTSSIINNAKERERVCVRARARACVCVCVYPSLTVCWQQHADLGGILKQRSTQHGWYLPLLLSPNEKCVEALTSKVLGKGEGGGGRQGDKNNGSKVKWRQVKGSRGKRNDTKNTDVFWNAKISQSVNISRRFSSSWPDNALTEDEGAAVLRNVVNCL